MSGSPTIVRKGWCPGVRRPMATGDGLLVRLHPLAGRLTANQARLIAGAARQYGNGHFDITARGNLQLRGIRQETYPGLMDLLEREGLAEPQEDGPNRLVMVPPLAGIDSSERVDILALATDIEENARSIRGLPAKFFISADGGGSLSPDKAGADLHLMARNNEMIAIALAGPNNWNWIGEISTRQTAEAVHAILSGYAAMRASGRTDARRLRDLEPDLILELVAQVRLQPTVPPPQHAPLPHAGILSIGDGEAVLLALPFGRCNAKQLEQAAAWSERFGSGEVRLSFTRGILITGIGQEHLRNLLDEATLAGFITETDDVRLALNACPGKPDCSSGMTAAPADALRIASICKGFLSQGVTLHVSGCAKGCARPGRSDLTLVGRVDGHYGVVLNGTSRDTPSLHLPLEDIMNRLLPLNCSDDLRHAFAEKVR